MLLLLCSTTMHNPQPFSPSWCCGRPHSRRQTSSDVATFGNHYWWYHGRPVGLLFHASTCGAVQRPCRAACMRSSGGASDAPAMADTDRQQYTSGVGSATPLDRTDDTARATPSEPWHRHHHHRHRSHNHSHNHHHSYNNKHENVCDVCVMVARSEGAGGGATCHVRCSCHCQWRSCLLKHMAAVHCGGMPTCEQHMQYVSNHA